MQRIDLSATQVIASVLATLTGALAASYLGVAGTVVWWWCPRSLLYARFTTKDGACALYAIGHFEDRRPAGTDQGP